MTKENKNSAPKETRRPATTSTANAYANATSDPSVSNTSGVKSTGKSNGIGSPNMVRWLKEKPCRYGL
ncbi:hypothetical protein LTR37_018724 [Vermiconidia calcicola]|uniref:Uncharacterized protein n=1 Tax=Vermiconidia calcicola TaxID=1690605 RepID=A0ACC3MGF7_9PEZI|nr:hypothetical protein LTR37_018724 [Vermiconidia calcicola]